MEGPAVVYGANCGSQKFNVFNIFPSPAPCEAILIKDHSCCMHQSSGVIKFHLKFSITRTTEPSDASRIIIIIITLPVVVELGSISMSSGGKSGEILAGWWWVQK